MPTRKAHARWEGTIEDGTGTLDFGSGAFEGAYSFGSRFVPVLTCSCAVRHARTRVGSDRT